MNEGSGHFHIEKQTVRMNHQHMVGFQRFAGMADGRRMVLFVKTGELPRPAAPGQKIPRAADANATVNADGTRCEFQKMQLADRSEIPAPHRLLGGWNEQRHLSDAFHCKKPLQNVGKHRLTRNDFAQP